MSIALLCFDLDDTLWPCAPTIMYAERTLYDWMCQQVPEITARHSIDSLRAQRMRFLRDHPQLQTDLSEARRQSLRALSDEFDLPHDWVEEAFQVFFQARQQVSLFDDVAPALDALSKRYRLVSMSNGNADIHHTGVAHWFEFHVAAADAGYAKPHPAIFERLLQRAGVEARAVVMIGDHPEHDIAGAQQLGMRSIWVNRQRRDWPLSERRPDAELIDFSYLGDLLRQIEDGA